MGTPIGEAAAAAANGGGGLDNGGDSNVDEDKINTQDPTEAAGPSPDPIAAFLAAEMRFVRTQTAFIHDNSQLAMMCSAQEAYIYALQDFMHTMGAF
jgi:hypothetical protein